MRSLRPGNHDTLSRSRWHLPSLPVQLAASRKFSDQRLHERAQQPTRRRDQRSGAQDEAALAEQRYQECDPANRLVAGTLERRWNDALLRLESSKTEAAQFQSQK